MNVSMQDAFNLGWKLAAVLRKQCCAEPAAFLFGRAPGGREGADRFRSRMGGDSRVRRQGRRRRCGQDAGLFCQARPLHRGHGDALHAVDPDRQQPSHQHLAQGLVIGTRFHSAPVIRLADAKPVHLGHAAQADGRFRIYAFSPAEDPAGPSSAIRALCNFLAEARESPVRRYTPVGADIDGVIDLRAVFQQDHRELAIEAMPPLLLPRKGRYGLIDYEKMFCPDLKKRARRFRDARHRSQGRLHGRGAARSVRRDRCCRSMILLRLPRTSTASCCRRTDGLAALLRAAPMNGG